MEYPEYDNYKETNIDWLGNIPKHWEIIKLSWLFKMIGSGTTPDTNNLDYYNGDIPWVNTSELRDDFINDTKKQITRKALNDISGLRLYPKNTLLIALYGATIGQLGILKIKATVNQACCALTEAKDNVHIKFIFYWLLANRNNILSYSYGGGQPNISQDTVRNLKITLPKFREQKVIVKYLDKETTRIDNLIKKKEKLIDFLEEKRQAVITQAVTKGLNPDASMKDSGLEWLGEIPEHWEAIKLKFLLKKKKNAIKTGPFGSQIKSSEMINSEIKVYNQNNVLENDINKGNNYISKEKYKELKSFEVYPGDILITTRGTIGEAVLLPQNIEKGILHPCLMRIQPDNNKLNSKYLEIIINESKFFRTQLFLASNGTTIDVIYSENLKNVKVILPPLEEQNRLFNYIKEYNNEIDTLICKVEKQISNLKEYRQALITNAVTGKIDVRDLV